MDYEKKYKEEVDRATQLWECGDITRENLEYIFPELKESEDERIKKFLIEDIKDTLSSEDFRHYNSEHTKKLEEALGWLEKQGEKETDPREENLEELLAADDIYQMAMNDDMVQEAKTKAINALSELQIGKLLGLEKQGEQKSVDTVEPKFKVGDWITNGDYTWKIVDVEPLDYILQSQDGNIVYDTISYVDEQFHSFTIEDAKPGDVIYLPNGNNEYYFFIFKGIENAAVMSFAHFYQYNDGTSKVEETIDRLSSVNDVFQPSTKEQRDLLFSQIKEAGYEWDAEKKELKKFKQEPIWEWDAEKKVLKKIENRPILSDFFNAEYERGKADALKCIGWSEEDNKWIESLIQTFEDGYFEEFNQLKSYGVIDWLKSLKNKYENKSNI